MDDILNLFQPKLKNSPTISPMFNCDFNIFQVPDYMLLVQLASADESAECDTQLKVMAVQTVNPYNWRTLQTHNIPNNFGR